MLARKIAGSRKETRLPTKQQEAGGGNLLARKTAKRQKINLLACKQQKAGGGEESA